MTLASLAMFREGWKFFEPALPLVMGGASVLILLGCAVASWVCPSRKEDCLFHREVM
jgi:hypothetical protein